MCWRIITWVQAWKYNPKYIIFGFSFVCFSCETYIWGIAVWRIRLITFSTSKKVDVGPVFTNTLNNNHFLSTSQIYINVHDNYIRHICQERSETPDPNKPYTKIHCSWTAEEWFPWRRAVKSHMFWVAYFARSTFFIFLRKPHMSR